jgi:hypothetical protein
MTGQRAAERVTAEHLRRNAYLYVRQSTLRQVMENTTSTDRQYGLRQRAVALGWALDQITVIDEDLGRSGATAEGRDGFQRLVADAGMGKAGIVIGLEVSRLARNNADWHRLLEICALTETLIHATSTTGSFSASKGRCPRPSCTCSRHGCAAGSSPRPAAASSSCRCPSAWSMTRPGAWSSIPTRACATPWPACSPPSPALARPGPP